MGVSEDLHLDVARAKHCLLQEHSRVTERAVCLTGSLNQSRTKILSLRNATHSTTAASGNSLHKDWETDFLGVADQFVNIRRLRR